MSAAVAETLLAAVCLALLTHAGVRVRRARRAREEALARFIAWHRWEHELAAGGWRHWLDKAPPSGLLIEALRQEWALPHIWRSGSEAPAMNISGLWWRPWQSPRLQEMVTRIEGMGLPAKSALGKPTDTPGAA